MKKHARLLAILAWLLVGNLGLAQNQHKIITDHPLYPFSRYSGDTVAYLTQNFNGGADNSYYEQPLSKFLQDLDPVIPIRTFYLYYSEDYNMPCILAFMCFPYTKEELKQLVAEEKTIYGIGIAIYPFVTLKRDAELYNYFKDLGFDRILPWSSEIEQKIGRLHFWQGAVQNITGDVKRYIENHPE